MARIALSPTLEIMEFPTMHTSWFAWALWFYGGDLSLSIISAVAAATVAKETSWYCVNFWFIWNCLIFVRLRGKLQQIFLYHVCEIQMNKKRVVYWPNKLNSSSALQFRYSYSAQFYVDTFSTYIERWADVGHAKWRQEIICIISLAIVALIKMTLAFGKRCLSAQIWDSRLSGWTFAQKKSFFALRK